MAAESGHFPIVVPQRTTEGGAPGAKAE
jgi:hypothetical protein